MTTYKGTKFPIEVTKGKAKDLYRLKFIRRSETEPYVRHFMKHSVGQMGKQLDIWFKEQSFTIGQLSREQEKVFKSCQRLRNEQRRIRKECYVRYQEEVRRKLQQIRTKLLMLKVVNRFKENVEANREYRDEEMGKRPKVDFLRVPGNEEYMFGPSVSKGERGVKKKDEGTQKKHKMTTSATTLSSKFEVVNAKHRHGSSEHEHDINDIKRDNLADIHPETDTDDQEPNTELSLLYSGDYTGGQQQQQQHQQSMHGNGGMAVFGQNFLPPASRLMETIPEENVEEVSVEMDDLREERKLTKRRLALFNRSTSKRNVFDDNAAVPLLPEVSSSRSRLVTRSVHADTEDKQTQTSFRSKEKEKTNQQKSSRGYNRIKKTIVVKLPRSKNHTNLAKKEEDVKSSTGNYGSGPEPDTDDDVFQDTDDETESDVDGYTLEADVLASDVDGWDGSDEDSDNLTDVSYQEQLHISVSYKPKSKSRKKPPLTSRDVKKVQEISKETKTYFRVIPDETTFPETPLTVQRQNPRSMLYKERSFFVAPDIVTRPCGSARYLSSRQLENLYNDSYEQTEPEKLQEIKKKRLVDIKRRLSRDDDVASPRGNKSTEKHTSKENSDTPSPPTSPKRGSRKGPRNNMSVSLLNHKKAQQSSDWKRNHDLASSDPVQKYERTKSGRLLPFGSPRVLHKHEVPTLKDQYYRDKLLKTERDSILHQNIKMKKFIDTFEKERVHTILPTIAGGSSGRTSHSTAESTGPSIGNFLFKVCESKADGVVRKKIVPSVATTSLRSLKNCRYLREYTPMSDEEKVMSIYGKGTSWNMDARHSTYDDNYIANVRLQLT